MALNPFFQQGSSTEQNLIQDLINEQLKMYGIEVHYLPRSFISEKTIIKEVIRSSFDNAYPIEAYIQNYEGYGDNPVILSKFGIQQTQEINLVISKERWETYIEPLLSGQENLKLTSRPKEGDLIYLPLGDRLYEIKYVEHEKPFYQLQKNYVYELRCELFRYENETINSGISEIDDELISGASTSSGLFVQEGILGPKQVLTLTGIGVTATATASIVNGGIRFITITNRGGGFIHSPTIGISSAPSSGISGIGTARMIKGIAYGNYNLDTKLSSVQNIDLINAGSGYTSVPSIKISGAKGVGAAATTLIGDGIVGTISIGTSGSGYVTPPTVTFTGVSTVSAAATTVLNSDGNLIGINLTNAGLGYTIAPTVTISNPSFVASGNFTFNEIITGSVSGTTAIVKTWDTITNILEVTNVTGTFVAGENVVGTSSSAINTIRTIELESDSGTFGDNDSIETESDDIIDFSESNPFGTV